MSADENLGGGRSPPGRGWLWAVFAVALAGLAAAVYIIMQASIIPGQASSLKSLAKGPMAKLRFPAEAGAAPPTTFFDADGKPVRLADFRGQVVVLNLWATWCAPCVLEMPTLAKLAKSVEGRPVKVIVLSIDGDRDAEKARLFIARHAPLAFYRDPKLKMPYDLKPAAEGMPTTVIFDRNGVEKARVSGDADWSSPEARAVVEKILADR